MCWCSKDDLTHYCELVACDSPTSTVAVDALMKWAKRFGMPRVWISDQGSHFKNKVMAALAHKLKVNHDFSLAYCPWRNGSVERMNRDILQVMRVLLREYRLAEHQWDYLLDVVQANLNQTPVASLANKSPMELFTALEPVTPLDIIIAGVNNEMQQVDWSTNKIQKELEALRASLAAMHREVSARDARRMEKEIKANIGNTICNVELGDYVLWSRVDEKLHPKLLVTWLGPYRVIEVSEFSVDIEHLITKETKKAHMSRVKHYADASLNVTEEILEHVSEQGILLKVREIEKHKFNTDVNDYLMHVYWEGFEDIEASWEPFKKLCDECPAVVAAYVNDLPAGDAKSEMLKLLPKMRK